MSRTALYDEDILLWSEQQAEVIRRLGRMHRDLPNELDVENVAEEIESVGRSELAAVQSYVELILQHIVKLSLDPDSSSSRHWLSEIISFHGNMRRRYAESMRQRIGPEEVWEQVRKQTIVASASPEETETRLPAVCPFRLDDILSDQVDASKLVAKLHAPGPRANQAAGEFGGEDSAATSVRDWSDFTDDR